MQKKPRRMDNAINAGSMADIAFLLLIFFLVTTTILNDKGILIKLPPISDIPAPPIPKRNVIDIKLNGDGALLFEGQPLMIENLRDQVKSYLLNANILPDLPVNPRRAVVSLQNDRDTPYENYLEVYDQLKAAYRDLWETTAQTQYHIGYEQLNESKQKIIRNQFPQVISEADPTDYSKDTHF